MAKQAALSEKLLIDGYDLSGDIGALTRIGSNSAVLDVTAINKAAMERILAHTDGALEFMAFFNDATAQEHVVLKAKGSGANRVATWLHGAAIGNVGAAIVAKQINYDPTRGQDGSLTEAIQLLAAAYGLDFATQLTAGLRTDTAATAGNSLNKGAASALGAAAYLQVTAFSGTDVTIAVQSSSDNGGGDAFSNITALVFTTLNAGNPAPFAERKATAAGAAIEQYLKVTTSTATSFSSVTFSVVLTRSLYAP